MSDTVKRALDASLRMRQQRASGGRLSDNVEDHRGLTRWNRPALDAINRANGLATEMYHPSAVVVENPLPPPPRPRSEPTMGNAGIDDLFTRTPTYHTAPTDDWRAQEAMWRALDERAAARNRATTTPQPQRETPISTATPRPTFSQQLWAGSGDGSTGNDDDITLNSQNMAYRAQGGRLAEINNYLDSYHLPDTPENRDQLKNLSRQKYYDGVETMSPEQQYKLDRLTRSYNAAPEVGSYKDPLQTWDDWAGEKMQYLQHGTGDNIAAGSFARGGAVANALRIAKTVGGSAFGYGNIGRPSYPVGPNPQWGAPQQAQPQPGTPTPAPMPTPGTPAPQPVTPMPGTPAPQMPQPMPAPVPMPTPQAPQPMPLPTPPQSTSTPMPAPAPAPAQTAMKVPSFGWSGPSGGGLDGRGGLGSRYALAGGGKVERILDGLGFYSKGREAAANGPQKMSPEAWQNYLLGGNRGVKANELKHADWQGQTKGIKSLSPSDAADLLQSSAPKIQEKVFREQEGPSPHYRSYTLGDEGEKNYTERLLHLPSGTFGNEDYYAPHFGGSGTPNILAHMRTVDRDFAGDLPLFGVRGPGKTLHVEEMQSDWGQQGRQEGWKPEQSKIDEYNDKYHALTTGIDQHRNLMQETKARLMREAAIPTYDDLMAEHGDKPWEDWQPIKSRWNRDIQDHVTHHPDYLAVAGAHDELLRQLRTLPTVNENGPPWHPLVADTNAWNDLTIKRALKVAAEGDYKSIGVSPGDTQFDRWDNEGLRDIYDNKLIPSLQSSLRRMDKAAGRRDTQGIGEEWHVTRNGDREDDWGNTLGRHDRQRDAQREADIANERETDDYLEHNGDRDPDMDHFEGDYYDVEKAHKAEIPTFNMTDEAAEKINREGFPYFADGGAVNDDDGPDMPIFAAMGIDHAPDSVKEQSRYAGDKLLGPGRDLPQGETTMSAPPSGLGAVMQYLPNPLNYGKRTAEAWNENTDAVKEGWHNGNPVQMGLGAMGAAFSPVTGAERVMVRDPYLNATGNLKDANSAESAADFAIFGGLRGALPHGMMKNPSTAFQTERAMPKINPGAAAAGAGAVGMTASPDDAQAIVPPDIARALKVAKTAGSNPWARDIAAGTKGAHVSDEDMLHMILQRYQKPQQAGDWSPRGGVFYMPEGDQNAARNYKDNGNRGIFYLGQRQEPLYGGQQHIKGETAFANPYFVRGATGGSAPEKAFAEMHGKSGLEDLQNEVSTAQAHNLPGYAREERVYDFLDKRAPDMIDRIPYQHVIDTSNRGNQLKYALQEAAIGQSLRDKGHDALISYGARRGGNGYRRGQPFANEVFDVREDRFPTREGGYSVWDKLKGDR